MGFLKDALEHDVIVPLKPYVLFWSSVLIVGLVVDHFFGWDILVRIFQIAVSRP